MKVLLVHGYEVMPGDDDFELSDYAHDVCVQVVRMHAIYERVLFISGWHMKLGPRPTIAEVMARWVKSRNAANSGKFLTQYDLGMEHRMPARCSLEEVEVGIEMVTELGLRVTEIAFVAQWFHVEADWYLYDHHGIATTPIPVFTPTISERIVGNAKAFVRAVQDPDGKSPEFLEYVKGRTFGGPPEYVNPFRP